MTDITQEVAQFATTPKIHGSLTEIIKRRVVGQVSKKRKDYYGVTDICNPLQTYFQLKYPDVFKDSIETKKRFALGNKQHNIIQKKLEFVDRFFDREIVYDGRLVGISLVGRADSKVGESIWEIKSKESLPESVNELIEKYPQDIEQLCFYSLIDPSTPKENVLIVTTHLDANKIKAFTIKILDAGRIKSIALRRIEQLNNWLDKDSASTFSFKCRYCYEDCSIRKEGKCSFFENKCMSCEVIDFIEITENPSVESVLGKIKVFEQDAMSFGLFNIITPRKVIHQEYEDIEEESFDNSFKNMNKQLIQEAMYDEKLFISNEEIKKLKGAQKIPEIFQGKSSFIKINLGDKSEIFPLIIHINPKTTPSVLRNVSPYKLGELGIHCINNGSNKGYIVAYFPNQNNEIRVFEINYNFNKNILTKIKKIVEIIKIKDKTQLKELPMCPDFICKGCAYKKVCLGNK